LNEPYFYFIIVDELPSFLYLEKLIFIFCFSLLTLGAYKFLLQAITARPELIAASNFVLLFISNLDQSFSF